MQRDTPTGSAPLSRFEDDFAGPEPRPDVWVTDYLPQWTTPDRSAARWRRIATGLQLRIEADQLDWRPEDAPLRVSNLQTGVHSGPVGSGIGTHRHRPDGLAVRTDVGTRLLGAPTSGHLEVTVGLTLAAATASDGRRNASPRRVVPTPGHGAASRWMAPGAAC